MLEEGIINIRQARIKVRKLTIQFTAILHPYQYALMYCDEKMMKRDTISLHTRRLGMCL